MFPLPPTDCLFSSKLSADQSRSLGSQTAMGAVLQIVAVLAFLVALALFAEVTWGLIRLRRLQQGVDIGAMPGGMGYWQGPRLKAAVVGLALALIAGAVAFGASTVMGATVKDFLTRLAAGALGAVWLHDAFRWDQSWFFRPGHLSRWARRQTPDAQTLCRLFIGSFGVLLLVGALFGRVP